MIKLLRIPDSPLHFMALLAVMSSICRFVASQPGPVFPSAAFQTSCTDSVSANNNPQACLTTAQNCIGGGALPCNDGNGDCSDTTCSQCGSPTSGLIVTLPGQGFTGYDSKCLPTQTPQVLYQIQPFIIGRPGYLQGPAVFQFPVKQTQVLSSQFPPKNDFIDGFSWSATVQGATGIFTKSHLYGSLTIANVPDSQSEVSTSSCLLGECVCTFPSKLYDSSNSSVFVCNPVYRTPTLQVAIGLVLGSLLSLAPFPATAPLLKYATDPLMFFGLVTNGPAGLGFATTDFPLLNFTLAAESLRMMRMGTREIIVFNYSRRYISGELKAFARPARPSRTAPQLFPDLVQTGYLPILLADALAREPNLQTPNSTSFVLQNISSTLGIGGSFSRSFSYTIGPSKRMSMLILERNFNVFAAGSTHRSTSFFTSEYTNDQTGAPIMTPFGIYRSASEKKAAISRRGYDVSTIFFHMVYPIKFEIIPSLCKIIYYSDGSNTMHPLPVGPFPAFNRTVAVDELPETPTYLAFVDFWTALPDPRVVSYQRVHTVGWITIVYHIGSTLCMFIGSNDQSHFGRAAGATTQTYSSLSGNFSFLLQPTENETNETISQVAIGETHTLILTGSGIVYISGNVVFNNTVDCTGTFVNTTKSVSLYPVFTKIEALQNVTSIGAGYNFSIFAYWNNSNPNVTRHCVAVCGGAVFMNPSRVGNLTELSSLGNPWVRSSTVFYSEIQSGAFHACVAYAGTSQMLGKTLNIVCAGRSDSSGSFASSNPLLNTVICSVNDKTYSVNSVDTFSVGRHHVAFTMRHLNVDQAASSFVNYKIMFTCGSNTFGQLGANLKASGAVLGGVWPSFPFSERVLSSRTPLTYISSNLELTNTDIASNYQLFESASIQAIHNTTYVFTKTRTFNNPYWFQLNYTTSAKHLPPDGTYHLKKIYADLFENGTSWMWDDIRTTGIGGPNRLENVDPKHMWFTTFSLMRGKALFLVANQTSGDGRFQDNLNINASDPFSSDPTNQFTSNFSDFSGADGTFVRDWSVFRGRNRTVQTLLFNTTTQIFFQTIYMVFIPQIFFLTETGLIFPYSRLTTLSSSAGPSCIIVDNATQTIVYSCGAAGSGTDAERLVPGYTSGLPRKWKWVSMFVSVRQFNLTFINAFPINSNFTAPANMSNDWGYYFGRSHYYRMNTLHGCEPVTSSMDCSGAVFNEFFCPTQMSPSQYLGYDVDGLVSVSSAAEALTYMQQSKFQTLTPNTGFMHLQAFNFSAGAAGFDKIVTRGLLEVACIFVKLGRYYYHVMLMRDKSVVLCNYRSLTRSTITKTQVIPPTTGVPNINPTAPPIPTPAPEPNVVPVGLRNFRTWDVTGPNQITLFTIDVRNNLMPQVIYVNGSAFTSFPDPRNLTLSMGPMGGVAVVSNVLDFSAFCFITNTSTQALLSETNLYNYLSFEDQRKLYTRGSPMSNASTHFISPLGTYATRYMPVVPVVVAFNVVSFKFRSGSPFVLTSEDSLVVRLINAGSENLTSAVQFAFSLRGATPEIIKDNTRYTNITQAFFSAVCTSKTQMLQPRDDIEQRIRDGAAFMFYCVKRSIAFAEWSQFTITYLDTITRLYLNGRIVGGGYLLTPQHLVKLKAMEFTIRNIVAATKASWQVQELIVCNDEIEMTGSVGATNIYPCAANGKIVIRRHRSVSKTPTVTETDSALVTFSQRLTDTKTLLVSTTKTDPTETEGKSSTFTTSMSDEKSASNSPSNEQSESLSYRLSKSHTKSNRIVKNVSLYEVDSLQSQLTSQNIRKLGQHILLYLSQDVFNPTVMWTNFASAYFVVTSNVTVNANPSGFIASFYTAGFVTGSFPIAENRSYLQLTMGPANFYNSYNNEQVTLRLINLGSASEFPVPGYIVLNIDGRGYHISSRALVAEGVAALFAVSGMLAGGPASLVLKIATNSVQLNFHCFNGERPYPVSFLMSPTSTSIAGSQKLGVVFLNLALALALMSIHAAIVYLLYRHKGCHIIKAQGQVAFPSLSAGMCCILLPGYIAGSWGGVAADNDKILVAVIISNILFVALPLAYLTKKLYGDACQAVFERFPDAQIAKMKETHPVKVLFVPTGWWTSVDRHRCFSKRFRFFLAEYDANFPYWYCIEFGEAIVMGVIASFDNSDQLVCKCQLASMAGLKSVIFIATLYFKPFSTPLLLWPCIVVHFAQAVALVILFIDTVNGGTKSYSLAAGTLLTATTIALMLISISATAANVFLSYEKWKQAKDIATQAVIFHKQHNESAADEDDEIEQEEDAAMVSAQADGGNAGNARKRANIRNTDDDEEMDDLASIGRAPTVPLRGGDLSGSQGATSPRSPGLQRQRSTSTVGIIEPDDDDSLSGEGGGRLKKRMSFVASSFGEMPHSASPTRGGSASLGKALSPAAAAVNDDPKARNFWRLAALEELGAAPATEIARAVDDDDDLL